MSKKKGNLLEQHVDKIVLGVIVVLSLAVLWLFVIRSPYSKQIQGRSYGPGNVHIPLEEKSQRLRGKLEGSPENPPPVQENFVAKFESLQNCSVPQISTSAMIPYPGAGDQPIEDREYAIPEIPNLKDVLSASVRGPAYIPVEEVTPEMPYQSVEAKLADQDLVTVSAVMDVPTLARNFQASFNSVSLKASHRSQDMAKPVIAKVELQRRTKRSDGTWGDWISVSRCMIDPYRKLIDQLTMSTDQMERGAVQLVMAQYNDPSLQNDILQPFPYDFVTQASLWLPPKYFNEYQELLKQEAEARKRELRTKPTEPTGTEMGLGMTPPGRTDSRQRSRGQTPDMMYGPGMDQQKPTRPGQVKKTYEEIIRDFQRELLTVRALWQSQKGELLIWAHDDTARPGNTYQYRIRYGVFNPIAGKDWHREGQEEYKSQVVLWSDYSEPTAEIAIGKKVHIFPLNMIAESGGVEVQVSKYYLGQWRSEKFQVLPGQVIGSEVEIKPVETSDQPGRMTGMELGMGTAPQTGVDPMNMGMGMGMDGTGMGGESASAPQTVDYTTDYLYMDVMGQVIWNSGPSLRRKEINSMLYTNDGLTVNSMPIGRRDWPSEIQTDYRFVQDAEKDAAGQTLLSRGSGLSVLGPAAGVPSGPAGTGMTGPTGMGAFPYEF